MRYPGPGTIFALPTAKGYAYLHLLGRQGGAMREHVCRLLPGRYATHPDVEALAAGEDYLVISLFLGVMYYPQRIVEKVGYYPIERFPIPRYTLMRRSPFKVKQDRKWYIYDRVVGRHTKSTDILTPEERTCGPHCIHILWSVLCDLEAGLSRATFLSDPFYSS